MADEDGPLPQVRVEYDSGERVYLQIVRIIRDMIISGELPVGARIPSGAQMKRAWGVNRLTGAMAVEELRTAGLVVTRPGVGTFVAGAPARQTVSLCPGDQVMSRMPTGEERARLGTGYLTPVLVITRADGRVEPYNAAVTVVRATAGGEGQDEARGGAPVRPRVNAEGPPAGSRPAGLRRSEAAAPPSSSCGGRGPGPGKR